MVLAAILIVTALILVNAVYVAAEFSAVGVRRSRLRALAEQGNPLARWLVPVMESRANLVCSKKSPAVRRGADWQPGQFSLMPFSAKYLTAPGW